LRKFRARSAGPRAPALSALAARHRDRNEAMAAVFATGQYSLAQIAEHFGVHHSTVSRVVKSSERVSRELV
jgi:transposase